MTKILLAVLMFGLAALSGCVDNDIDGEAVTGSNEPVEDEPNGIPAPEWQVGDAWIWADDWNEYTFVVTEVTDATYQVGTSSETMAFLEALEDGTEIGEYRVSDLAPGGDVGTPEKWFDFPLQAGNSWPLQEYGESYTVHARELKSDGRFHLQALRADDTVAFDYHYSVTHEWYADWAHVSPEGDVWYEAMVTKETNTPTNHVVATVTTLVEKSGQGPHAETVTNWDFSDKLDADIYAELWLYCTQGGQFLGIGPIESLAGVGPSDGFSFPLECPVSSEYFGIVGEYPEQGTWGYAIDVASPDANWGLRAWLAEYERPAIQA